MRVGSILRAGLTAPAAFLVARLGSIRIDLGLDDVDERTDGDDAGLDSFLVYLRGLDRNATDAGTATSRPAASQVRQAA
jgi:hypothetical protein